MIRILPLILFFFVYCTSVNKKDNLPSENRSANLKVVLNNSEENEAKLHLYLCQNLNQSEIKMLSECEFKMIHSFRNKSDAVNFDLPPGEYFAVIQISDKRIIPILYSETTGQKIHFGFKTEVTDSFFYRTHFEETKITSCQSVTILSYSEDYYCPKLILKENIQTTFRFEIENDLQFDERGTSLIWLSTLYISLQVMFPIPIPLITGIFAFKRRVSNNLK
ncbi:MAG TPA: hypothetical protein PK079_13430 [Leptospiraceae bacterium]|nr:hypothetical protein [Leptospiraceae bacterium]HMW05306.1 hypothetical protein [Leptospiraceae bacterium]HMX32937.1 hypothetical protein [Leptospiraceae bacterium]HMY31502.1 hypothetical protein [Leptospiraceae bacterium]HNA06656.1 hypothetical protein [Leptospiraceae bacterium]